MVRADITLVRNRHVIGFIPDISDAMIVTHYDTEHRFSNLKITKVMLGMKPPFLLSDYVFTVMVVVFYGKPFLRYWFLVFLFFSIYDDCMIEGFKEYYRFSKKLPMK